MSLYVLFCCCFFFLLVYGVFLHCTYLFLLRSIYLCVDNRAAVQGPNCSPGSFLKKIREWKVLYTAQQVMCEAVTT
jgi:hypothetical protein